MNYNSNPANNDSSIIGERFSRRRRPTLNLAIKVLAILFLGSAKVAHAAQDGPTCTLERCSAHLDSTAIPQAVRDVVRDVVRKSGGTTIDKPRGRASTAPFETSLAASTAWERRLGSPGAREDYNCALSVGVGGTLGGDRFLATRALGHTKVWRSE